MTYYGIHCWDEKIWDEMWAKKAEDITLGFNNGYYKGAEAICGYYKANAELMKLRTEVVKAANPDKFEGKTVEEIFGAGSLDVNNFTTPIVELAEPLPVLPEYAAIADFQFPEPNVPAEVYEHWHDRRKNVDFPGVPQPYHSFADTFTYGL